MNIKVMTDSAVTRVKLIGSIDDPGARELKAELAKYAVQESSDVKFDFGAVTYICSSGIGALLEFYTTQRAGGGVMGIEGMSQPMFDMFSRVKLDLVLGISPPRG